MANKLQRFSLFKKNNKWQLRNETINKDVKQFKVKEDATKGGVFKGLLGKAGGSVRIKKENGRYQEERTYPRSQDPRSSKG